MRKMVYLPNHLMERLRTYRQRCGVEEAVALMRLVSLGLDKVAEEEEEHENGQANDVLMTIYR